MTDFRLLKAQLEKYGFTENEAKVYVHLSQAGYPASVLQIARALKLGRTPVYNALDWLEDKRVVIKTITDAGHSYAAAPANSLENYWKLKTARVNGLGEQLPALVATLEKLAAPADYRSQINYFTGRYGIEQITYNSLRAENDLYIYEVNADMTAFTNQETAERFRKVWVERGTKIHQLTNSVRFEDFTDVEAMVTGFWDVRHINPEVLQINFETLIYNDTVAFYSYVGDDAFGVEIVNPSLAQMQKQIFRAIQKLATPFEIVSPKGAARLPGSSGV